ncbi:MAG: hypothetical protein L6R39_007028 [Caloplaca ligustica]|nr:MAG: hypothetical protein L6R39_007028 [Caloplaca ligustica]
MVTPTTASSPSASAQHVTLTLPPTQGAPSTNPHHDSSSPEQSQASPNQRETRTPTIATAPTFATLLRQIEWLYAKNDALQQEIAHGDVKLNSFVALNRKPYEAMMWMDRKTVAAAKAAVVEFHAEICTRDLVP